MWLCVMVAVLWLGLKCGRTHYILHFEFSMCVLCNSTVTFCSCNKVTFLSYSCVVFVSIAVFSPYPQTAVMQLG